MIYEYKLIPLNRKTGKPAFAPEALEPQFTVDIDRLYQAMNEVNPASSQGPLVAAVMTPERDKQAMVGSTAWALSEMFGADVYFREEGKADWHKQSSMWRPRR